MQMGRFAACPYLVVLYDDGHPFFCAVFFGVDVGLSDSFCMNDSVCVYRGDVIVGACVLRLVAGGDSGFCPAAFSDAKRYAF